MEKLECIVKAIDDKLGSDIVAIDMQMASPMFDTFVLCSASNERLMQAIKESVVDECQKHGYDIKHVEGGKTSKWILIDAGDIVCHNFDKNERQNYNLEKLWGDMPQLDVSEYLS